VCIYYIVELLKRHTVNVSLFLNYIQLQSSVILLIIRDITVQRTKENIGHNKKM
jgi:hypothetical protein